MTGQEQPQVGDLVVVDSIDRIIRKHNGVTAVVVAKGTSLTSGIERYRLEGINTWLYGDEIRLVSHAS